MRIEWSARARTDLRELRAYIARDSRYYARRFVARIIAAVEKLIDHPRLGRRVPEAEDENIRELIFEHYRIIYRVNSDGLAIVTVLHGSRDLASRDVKPWTTE